MPTGIQGRFQQLYHVADLHIRRTAERALEYQHVFSQLCTFLQSQSSVTSGSALIIIAGDVFEDKRALDAYAESTFVSLMRDLTALAPVVIIPGNHDFCQTEPQRRDRISHALDVMMTCGAPAHPVAYLQSSGVYRVGNICVCTASVYDTLSSTCGSGNAAQLPPFPACSSADPGAEHVIALAHMTVRSEASCDPSHGCSLSWFRDAGHSMVLLGDEHAPRVWQQDSPRFVAAQPGSILAQTFGEAVRGHGLCVWDLPRMSVRQHELDNPFAGVTALRDNDGQLQFRVQGRNRGRGAQVSAGEVTSTPDFPTQPRIRLLGSLTPEDVVSELPATVHPTSFVRHALSSAEEWVGAARAASACRQACADLMEFASPEHMIAYVRSVAGDSEHMAMMEQMILDPQTHLALPAFEHAPTAVRWALQSAQTGKRGKRSDPSICQALQSFAEVAAPKHPAVAFVRLQGSWVTAFESLELDLETLPITTLVDGPNGHGKSSVLDTLKLALYGLDGIGEHRREYDTRRTGEQAQRESLKHYNVVNTSKPARKVAQTSLTVRVSEDSVEGTVTYAIERQFGSTRDIKPRVRRMCSSGPEDICAGQVSVSKWVSARFGSAADISMCAILAQSHAASFMTMRASARKDLIERTLSLCAINHFADALKANMKGRSSALVAADAAIGDHARAANLPPRPSHDSISELREAVRALQEQMASLDHEQRSLVCKMDNYSAAMRAHDSEHSIDNLKSCLAAICMRAQEEETLFTELDAEQLAEAHERARCMESQIANLGPSEHSAQAALEEAQCQMLHAERELLAAHVAEWHSEAYVACQERLQQARATIAHICSSSDAVPLPPMQRPALLSSCTDADVTMDHIRHSIHELQEMPQQVTADALAEWERKLQSWDELAAQVEGTTLEAARDRLQKAEEHAALVAEDASLRAELGLQLQLQFRASCECCRHNQSILISSEKHARLASVQRQMKELGNAPNMAEATAVLADVKQVCVQRASISELQQQHSRATQTNALRKQREGALAHLWWGAHERQAQALADARRDEAEQLAIMALADALERAQKHKDQMQERVDKASATEHLRSQLNGELEALKASVSRLRDLQSRTQELTKLKVQAQDAVWYAEVSDIRAELDRKRSEINEQQRRLHQATAHLASWDAHDTTAKELQQVRNDISAGQAPVKLLHSIVCGNVAAPGQHSYSAHVFNTLVLPRIADAMNAFLEEAATYQVVVAGNDLEVRFDGASTNTDLNQLGGADRFVLELAGRCALRQLGTPGFNWPVAFIDEGFVAFDAARREHIASILAAMVTVGGFDRIVLTSHLECVKAVCRKAVCIERVGRASRLCLRAK